MKILQKRHTYSIGLITVRYTLLTLLGIALVALLIDYVFSYRVLYQANYGETYAVSEIMELAKKKSTKIKESDIPAAYHYAIYSSSGTLISTDLTAIQAKSLRKQVCITRHSDMTEDDLQPTNSATSNKNSETTTAKVSSTCSTQIRNKAEFVGTTLNNLPDTSALCDETVNGGNIILSYAVQARFTTRALRDNLPPAELFVDITVICLVFLIIILFNSLQNRRLRKEFNSLSKIAESINTENLDSELIHSKVTEVENVVDSFDIMRHSLADSLNKRFAAEEAQRLHVESLSHDIKTPLTVARGNAELINTTSLDDEQQTYASSILLAIDTIDSYISALNTPTSKKEKISITEFADFTSQYCKELAASAESEIAVSRLSDLEHISGFLSLDKTAWKRVVGNITSNAMSHGKSNQPIELSIAAENSHVIVSIRDYGTGFSENALKHATDWFYTTSTGVHTADGNTRDLARTPGSHKGIGLAVVQSIISDLSGTLAIENVPDYSGNITGSRITITLPILS